MTVKEIIQEETGFADLVEVDRLDELGIDSLDLMSLFLVLSDKTRISYKPEDVVKSETVGDLVKLFAV